MDKRRILIVDRDPVVTSQLAEFLEDEPDELVTTKDGQKGLEIMRKEKIDLAVVEACVKDEDGATLLEGMKAEEIRIEMLLVTSLGTLKSGKTPHKAYAMGTVDKPLEREEFLANIRRKMPLRDTWKLRMESFLENNHDNPELKFVDVQRHFKFSRTYGYRLFKRYLGESFGVRLRNVRLAKAKEALKHTSASISEIAYQCGFASLSTFSKVFKAKFGINPTTYRRNWKLGQI